MRGKFIDLKGQRFGRLLVLDRNDIKIGGPPFWNCVCDCGNIKAISGNNLRIQKTRSCGCLHGGPPSVDHTGKRYGRILIISRTGSNKRGSLTWNCVCDCGKEFITTNGSLHNGTQSCGCLFKEKSAIAAVTHGLSKTNRYELWSGAKYRAKKHNIIFDLALEDMPEIPDFCPVLGISLQKNIGGTSHRDNSPSLDRIIPALGYVKGNVQIISQRANVIKNEGTAEEHRKIAEYIEMNTHKVIKERELVQ